MARESAFVQDGPNGRLLIVVTHFGAPPPAAAIENYVGSQHAFDTWFKGQVRAVTGMDPDATPMGPPSECVFDTEDIGGVAQGSV